MLAITDRVGKSFLWIFGGRGGDPNSLADYYYGDIW